jgi:transcriptional regulator with XRE-family HTH domain
VSSGTLIRSTRERHRLTQAQLALRAGTSQNALNDHRVDYLIIGGVAVQAYGHVRTTQDVDVIVAPDARNLERLAAALTSREGRDAGTHEIFKKA